MYFFLRDGFFLLPPARSSSLLVGPLLMTFMVKTITALEPLALTSDKSDCISSNDGLVLSSSGHNLDMLRATIGGLGLTGVIAWADVQLKRVAAGPWIDAELVPFQSLNSFLALSRESNDRFEYTVAWLDCFAGKNLRGIFFRGNHAAERGKDFHSRRGPKLPFALPAWMLNKYSVKAFNTAYYRIHAAREGAGVVAYDSFFYPLDSIRQWNLLMADRVSAISARNSETNLEAFEELLDRIARLAWVFFGRLEAVRLRATGRGCCHFHAPDNHRARLCDAGRANTSTYGIAG